MELKRECTIGEMKKMLLLFFFSWGCTLAFSQSSIELFREFQTYRDDPVQQKTASYVSDQLLDRIHRDFVAGSQVDLTMLVEVGNFYFDAGNFPGGQAVYRRWKQYTSRLFPEGAPLPADPEVLIRHLQFLKDAPDLAAARLYALQLDSLATNLMDVTENDPRGLICRELGDYYFLQGDKDSALRAYEQFQKRVEKEGDNSFGPCVLDLEGMELVNTNQLYFAIRRNDLELVQSLLDGEVQVDCDLIKGIFPLTLATRNENYPILYALLEHGANVNIPLDDGNLLHYAIRHQDVPLARKLLQAGINIYRLDNSGTSAKFLAEQNGQFEISSLIAEHRYQENNLAIQLGHRNVIRHFAVSRNGQFLASCEMKRNFIKLWDFRSRLEFKSIDIGDEPTRISFSSDDKKIYIATANCALFSYEIESGAVEKIADNDHARFEISPGQYGNKREENYPLAYCEPDELLAVYGFTSFFSDAYIEMIHLEGSQKNIRIQTDASRFDKLAFSPKGDILAGISEKDKLYFWDVRSAQLIDTVHLGVQGFSMEVDLDFSPEGDYIAVGGFGNQLKVYDLRTRNFVLERTEVDSVVYAPNAQWVTSDKKGLGYFKYREILSVLFWNDTTVLSAGTDGNIRFWSIPSGKMIRKIPVSPVTIYNCRRGSGPGTLIFSTTKYLGYLDVGSGQAFFLQPGIIFSSLLFDLGDPYQLYFGFGQDVKMFDLSTGGLTQICSVPSDGETVFAVRLIPGTSKLIICSYRSDPGIELGKLVPGPDPKHQALQHKYESKSFLPRYGMMMQNILPGENENPSGAGSGTVFLYDQETHSILWKNKLKGVNFLSSCSISPDRERVVLLKNGAEILLYDLADGEERSYWSPYRINEVGFFQNSSTLINLEDEEITTIPISDQIKREAYYDSSDILFFLTYGKGNLGDMAISPSGKYIAYSRYEVSMPTKIQVYDAEEKKEMFLDFDGANEMCFSPVDTILAGGGPFGNVFLWDVKNNRGLAMVREMEEEIQELTFDHTGRMLFVNTESTVLVYDVSDPTFPRLKTYIFREGDQFLIALPDGYYFSDKGFKSPLAFRRNNRAYPFEQFDLVYNLPSKVIGVFAPDGDPVVKKFEALYAKRLQKMGFSGSMIDSTLSAPDVRILSEDIPVSTNEPQLAFEVWMRDTIHWLDRINVFVNDVPIYGKAGIDLRGEHLRELERRIELTLSRGLNKIQVSALNQGGAESLRETVFVSYQGPETLPDLYLVAMGVSDYGNPKLNLRYAQKDAKDFADLFRDASDHYRTISVDTLYNRNLTKGKLAALKEKLNNSQVDDVVILFFAGHGILDEDLNYYLATSETNFKAPAGKAISYDELEWLLDGIPARQKLLMIDACFSGEIDKDAVQLAEADNLEKGKVTFRVLGEQVVEKEAGGLSVLQEVKELFNDIRRGSGATAIASASGAEFAIEGEEWKNGVFTYCFLKGLKGMEADLNGDGSVWVSEMHRYLSSKVPELTDGNQRPNFRIENISNDWVLWEVGQ